jgi:hypothetical protein
MTAAAMNSSTLDPAALGEHVGASFEVRRLPSARLLWLNERWLIEAGIAPGDGAARESFVGRIMRDFAVTSVASDVPGTTSGSELRLSADRYGGSGGELHGGSGRCGSKDGFIAKGIGKTPLVTEQVDIYHKNGRMSVSEALRETINAEIVNRELPWGAIPTVAIIDAGFDFPYGESQEPHRAAIVVRPAFIRPAHFERSIFFGSGGYRDSAQFKDALRVRDATRAAAAAPEVYPPLLDMFRRFAQQIGVARARRLWQGRFLSSNVSINGALVDFGSFRALSNWRRTIGVAGECFGTEMDQLRRAFLSVAGYFGKYAPEQLSDLDPRAYLRELIQVEHAAFLDSCFSGCGVTAREGSGAQRLAACIDAYYHCQQAARIGVNVGDSSRWIYDALVERAGTRPANSVERVVEADVLAAIRNAAPEAKQGGAGLQKAREFFRPRGLLSYFALDRRARRIERLVAGRADAARMVRDYIASELAFNLYRTRFTPSQLLPLSAACDVHTSIVLCEDSNRQARTFWVEAAARGGNAYVLNCEVPLDRLAGGIVPLGPHLVGFEVPARCYESGYLSIAGSRVQIGIQFRSAAG